MVNTSDTRDSGASGRGGVRGSGDTGRADSADTAGGANAVRGAGKPALSVRRFADRAELTEALADRLGRALAGADGPGAAAVMLSGGETPMPAYRLLAQRGIVPAPGLSIYFSDDRYVPSDSDASNFHQSRPLLDALAPERVLRVKTELPLAQAAADYDRALASLAAAGARFGLGLLGLGTDGHTASLFGRQDIERARGQRAIAVHRPDGRDAVSVTPAVLARASEIIFLVAGAQKRAALAALLDRDAELTAWQAVSGCAAVAVWADREALPAP